MTMSKSSPRELQELMTAVDAGGHAADGGGNVDSASSDGSKLPMRPRRRSASNGRGAGGGVRKGAPPAVAVVLEASSDAAASFEFGAVVNTNSSASPASMVFSEGQLRAHHFPAVRSSAASAGAAASNQPALSPARTKKQAGVTAGSTKRVSFATDSPGKAGGGQGKKSGGLLGCCGSSSRKEAVEPVARNDNRKVEAF